MRPVPIAANSSPSASGASNLVVGHYNEAALAALMPDKSSHAARLSRASRFSNPASFWLSKPTIPEIQQYAQTAHTERPRATLASLCMMAISRRIFSTSCVIPKQTPEGQEGGAAIECASSSSHPMSKRPLRPRLSWPGQMSSSIVLNAELTDVYGEKKATPDAIDSGNSLSGDSPVLIKQNLKKEIRSTVTKLTASGSELIRALPKRQTSN